MLTFVAFGTPHFCKSRIFMKNFMKIYSDLFLDYKAVIAMSHASAMVEYFLIVNNNKK